MKGLKLLVILPLIFLLSGCMPQNTEIKYRLVIEGAGVDYDEERDEFTVTVQTAEAKEGESSSQSKAYVSRGRTVAEAVTALTEQTGRYPLYSQNRVIVLGSTVKGENFARALNFFVREYTSRPDVYVVMSTGSAEEILSREGTARLLETELDLASDISASVDTELFDCVNLALEKGMDIVLPLAEIADDTVKITGSAVAAVNERVHLSDSETFYLLLATDKVKKGTLEADTAALEIMHSDTDISVSSVNGAPYMKIQIKMTVDVIEYGADFTDLDENAVREIEKNASARISEGVEALLNRVLREKNIDILRLGKRLSLAEMTDVTADESEWKNSLSQLEADVSAEVKVGRIGQMTVSKQIEKK